MDKMLLKKRFIVATLLDKLKPEMELAHTRHSSPKNACVPILSCLAAYMVDKNKMKDIA